MNILKDKINNYFSILKMKKLNYQQKYRIILETEIFRTYKLHQNKKKLKTFKN